MPRMTFTYDLDTGGDLGRRFDDLTATEGTFWSGRSRSAIVKELVKRALAQVEAELASRDSGGEDKGG